MRSDNQMTPRSPIAVFAYSILTLLSTKLPTANIQHRCRSWLSGYWAPLVVPLCSMHLTSHMSSPLSPSPRTVRVMDIIIPMHPTIANPVRSQLRQHHVIMLVIPPIPRLWGRHCNPFSRTRRIQSTHTPKYRLFTTSHPPVHFHHNRHSPPPLQYPIHLLLTQQKALVPRATRTIFSNNWKIVPSWIATISQIRNKHNQLAVHLISCRTTEAPNATMEVHCHRRSY